MLRQAEIVGANLYPKVNGSKPFAWLWVRTVECPNPACKCKMPLASSFVLSKRAGNAYWAEPVQNGDEFAFRIHKGICPEEKATNKVGSAGAKFQCSACGDLATDDYIKKAGQQHRLGMQLMAVVGTDADKKVYFEPDAAQIHASKMPKPDDLPTGSISTNAHWFSPPGFGLTEYADLFTARQLEMLTAFCNLIPQVVDKVASDALAVGMSDSSGPLADGGNGALAYGQAVGTYLALASQQNDDLSFNDLHLEQPKRNRACCHNAAGYPHDMDFCREKPVCRHNGVLFCDRGLYCGFCCLPADARQRPCDPAGCCPQGVSEKRNPVCRTALLRQCRLRGYVGLFLYLAA